MSFLGGAECSTAGNPLSQFTKHVQHDNSLQRDRLGDRHPGGLGEGIRSRATTNGSDQMMNDFLQKPPSLSPFSMERIRVDLPSMHSPAQRTPSPSWAAGFDMREQARMEAAFPFPAQQSGRGLVEGLNSADFARFQQQNRPGALKSPISPAVHSPLAGNGYQGATSMGYTKYPGTGLALGLGMHSPSYSGFNMQEQMSSGSNAKGKSRMVELDDSSWEAQFKELENAPQEEDNLSEEARRAMEPMLDELDRSVSSETNEIGDFESIWRGIQAERESRQMADDQGAFARPFSDEDLAAWENFDSGMGLNTHSDLSNQDPHLGPYVFEAHNPFLENPTPSASAFDQGLQIMKEHGNLSLAALAFEAAVQQDANHVEAWTLLGSAQAQNEKESPAIRALEHALDLDPTNSDALMSLSVSYTNEGYDSTAYRTLERWLSVKYPQIHPPDQVSQTNDLGFTDREMLHDRVTNLFIRAAQLSPSGAQMDPDVQVGLGVLFYGAEDFDKAVDCFHAALASTVTGIVNREGQIHLLWNRLGATLANSGRSEDAISAYEKALQVNPNFVRARYNLGVSCINIGCHPQAAQHLLGALSMHRVVEEQGLDRVREIMGAGGDTSTTANHATNPASASTSSTPTFLDDQSLERMIQQNESSNLYDTLRRAFTGMNRRDLTDRVGPGMSLDSFRDEFDF